MEDLTKQEKKKLNCREWRKRNAEYKKLMNKIYYDTGYFQEYYLINKNKLTEKHKCLVCEGSYNLLNKARHDKTQKHNKKL